MPWTRSLCKKLALAAHISIAPGPMFSNHGEFRHCLRLNFGHPWNPGVEHALATLGRLAAGQPPRGAAR